MCSFYGQFSRGKFCNFLIYVKLKIFLIFFSQYADPVADFLDKYDVFKFRLFRDSCVYFKGGYVKVKR